VRASDGVVLKKFNTNPLTKKNGLATPGVVLNAGKLQYAYAGDYLGNVWRFDLTGIPGGSVNLSGTGTRKWVGFATPRQPIVAAVAVSDSGTDAKDRDVQNKRFLFFGTGSDLTSADASNTELQSIYGLIEADTDQDIAVGTNTVIAYRGLTQRFLNTTTGTYTGFRANLDVDVRAFYVPTAGDMAGKSGWFLNWTTPANSASEKVFTTATVRSATTPTLVVSSNIMNTNTCSGSGAGYLNALDAYSGGGLITSYFDIDRDRSFDNERLGGLAIGSVDFRIGNIGQASFPGDNVVVQGNKERPDPLPSGGSPGAGGSPGNDNGDGRTGGSTKVSRRISWREIVK
jgi:type IV pilus assembly protein PilY1